MLYRHTLYDTPAGNLDLLADDWAILRVSFLGNERMEQTDGPPNDVLQQAIDELEAYFERRLKCFTVPVAPEGTEFQIQVWEQLQQIPWGETRSYGEIAAALGKPGASRAVGMANNKNPIPIIIPCHRVIGSSGKLVGFGGGLDLKQRLLDLEQSQLGLALG